MGSLPDFLPGYQTIDDSNAREKFEQRWGSQLPTGAGLTAVEMIEQAEAGKIKAMMVVGENPLLSFPSPTRVRKALTSLDALVVADMFLTETAELATVVLPAASFAEKEGTFTNFEGRVQRVRKAIEPFGDSLPDWEIIVRLASSMGHVMPYSSPHQIKDEIDQLVPFYQRLAHHYLETEDSDWADLESERLGARRLYEGPFPSGFGRFSPVENATPKTVPRDGYPLTLLSGSILQHFGSGTRSLRASRLRNFSSRGWVEVSQADAEHLGYSNGESVRVISPDGEVATTVRITESLPQGMVFMPISFPDSPVNRLFSIALDPRVKTPDLKSCPIRLERTVNDG